MIKLGGTLCWMVALATLAMSAPAFADTAADVQSALQAGDLDRAIELGQRSLQRDPDPVVAAAVAEAWLRKVKAANDKGADLPELLVMVDKGLAVLRTPKLLKSRGRILSALNRDVEGYEAYEEALERGATGKEAGDVAIGMGELHAKIGLHLCRLVVTSLPVGASVQVGASPTNAPTPVKQWVPRGPIVLRLEGASPPPVTVTKLCAGAPVVVHVDIAGKSVISTPPPGKPRRPGMAELLPGDVDKTPRWHQPVQLGLAGVGVATFGLGLYWNYNYNQQARARTADPDQRTAAVSAYALGSTLIVAGIVWWWMDR